MTPRTKAVLIGGGVSLGVWVAWFALYINQKKPALARLATEVAPSIAEDAAKAYLAQHYGLTPEIMQRISTRAGQISSVVSAFRG